MSNFTLKAKESSKQRNCHQWQQIALFLDSMPKRPPAYITKRGTVARAVSAVVSPVLAPKLKAVRS